MAGAAPKTTSGPTAGVRHGLLRWVEPWYTAYGIDGLVLLGIAPILLPLAVDPAGPTAVGIAIAAFYVGALFTPLFGSLADRHGIQRGMFLACFPAMAVGLILFPFVDALWGWVPLAIVVGGAGAIAGTIGGMFIVEGHPKPEWNIRISWFRLAYGAGQVAGLALAAFTVSHLTVGWIVAGVLALAGVAFARWGVPGHLHAADDDTAAHLRPAASHRPLGAINWALHRFHRPDLSKLGVAFHGRYGSFILAWLATMIGVQTFFNVTPLVMRDVFSVSPARTSWLFLIGAAIGAVVFPALGRLADRAGPGRVMGLGLLITLGSFGGMVLLSFASAGWVGDAASVLLVTAAIAYSFNVVGATMLTVRLAPFSEGAAMGFLNSAIALGAIIGAIVPGILADVFSYKAIPIMAAVSLVVAILIGSRVLLSSEGRLADGGSGGQHDGPSRKAGVQTG